MRQFYGEEPLGGVQQQLLRMPSEDKAARPVRESREAREAREAREQQQQEGGAGSKTPAAAAAQQGFKKADKKGDKAGSKSKGKGADAAGLSRLRLEDGPGGAGKAAAVASTPVASVAPAGTPVTSPLTELGAVRGPKALFKQWKILQQQGATAEVWACV